MKTMKKIVAILAVALMLCSILPLSAFAADTTVVFELGANGTATHYDGTSATTYSETVGDYTLSITGGTKMYTGARDAKGNSCLKLGTGSAAGSFTISNIPDDVTAVVIAVAAYKAKTATMNINGTTTTLTTKSDNGQYDQITVDTTSTKSISVKVSSGYRAMVNSITFVISAPASAECDHDSLVCGDTCPECGNYTKEHKYTNNCVAECENGCGTANPNYADHVYAGIYDVECDVCLAKRVIEGMPAADSELTIPEAIALGEGVGTNGYTEGKYYITGVITEIYNTQYGNLYITDGENTFTVYGLYDGNGNRFDAMAEKPEAGMTIKVYGIIGNYNGAAQMKNGDLIEATGGCEHEYEFECSTVCSLCGYGEREAACVNDADYLCELGACIYCGNEVAALEHDFDDEWDPDCNYGCGYTREVEERPAISEHTIQFDSGKTQRTEFSTTKQVWSDGTLTFINNKASSTNAIADYTNPVRLYAGSEIVIECGGMTEIVFDCNNATYATALKNSIGDAATVSSDKVTVTLEGVDSFTVAKLTAQVRIDSITVTAVRKGDADCAHEWSEATCTEPATCALCGAVDGEALGHDWEIISQENATCTNAGSIVYECAGCGEDKSETFPALSHTYVDGICSGCGAELPLESTITFDADKTQRKEFGNESQKWENTGLVLINNKGSYTSNLGDYSNPLRMYKGTEIIISFPGMTSLVIDGPAAADYAWDATLAGYTFTVADGVYTITFAEPTDSITLTAANQVRANKITASRVVACQHEYDSACDVDCNLCYETREVSHNVVHVEATAATCVANGNIEYWYCDVCGMAWLNAECTMNTNLRAVVLPATGEHTYFDACSAICEVCGYEREVSHNVIHVEAVAATCVANGNIEYWYCDVCGMAWLDADCIMNTNLRAVVLPATGEHTYANDFDVDCDVCGAIREVAFPVAEAGKSISEDVSGYAVLFEADVDDLVLAADGSADYTNATYNGNKLLGLGVTASNGKSEKTIEGTRVYGYNDETGDLWFAFRIINIPESGYETEITMVPYYIVEIDGVATTIEGEAIVGSYANTADAAFID